MARTEVLRREGQVLTVDMDQLEEFQTPREVYPNPENPRERLLGKSSLVLEFKEGSHPIWVNAAVWDNRDKE